MADGKLMDGHLEIEFFYDLDGFDLLTMAIVLTEKVFCLVRAVKL